MHMHLSEDICHLTTRFQLQTKNHVFSSVLKTPDIFIWQCYLAINFVKYEAKKQCKTKTKKNYETELSQGFSIMRAKELHHYRNERPRWGCRCHGKERKHGRAGIGIGINMLPLEACNFGLDDYRKSLSSGQAGFFSNFPSHLLLS